MKSKRVTGTIPYERVEGHLVVAVTNMGSVIVMKNEWAVVVGLVHGRRRCCRKRSWKRMVRGTTKTKD